MRYIGMREALDSLCRALSAALPKRSAGPSPSGYLSLISRKLARLRPHSASSSVTSSVCGAASGRSEATTFAIQSTSEGKSGSCSASERHFFLNCGKSAFRAHSCHVPAGGRGGDVELVDRERIGCAMLVDRERISG